MRKLAALVIAIPAFGVVAGCETFPPTLVDQGIVRTETVDGGRVRVGWVNVSQEEKVMVVRGEAAHSPWDTSRFINGHIDIDVISPTGETITKQYVSLIRKRIPKQRGLRATFVSRFNFSPPKGTTVRISYHNRLHGSLS